MAIGITAIDGPLGGATPLREEVITATGPLFGLTAHQAAVTPIKTFFESITITSTFFETKTIYETILSHTIVTQTETVTSTSLVIAPLTTTLLATAEATTTAVTTISLTKTVTTIDETVTNPVNHALLGGFIAVAVLSLLLACFLAVLFLTKRVRLPNFRRNEGYLANRHRGYVDEHRRVAPAQVELDQVPRPVAMQVSGAPRRAGPAAADVEGVSTARGQVGKLQSETPPPQYSEAAGRVGGEEKNAF